MQIISSVLPHLSRKSLFQLWKKIDRRKSFWGAICASLLLGGCNQLWSEATLTTPTPQVLSPDLLSNDAVDQEVIETVVRQERQMVIWLPASMSYEEETNAGAILASVYTQFEQAHPGVRIEVQIKADTGEASLFSYLQMAQRVAPTILPDLVLLDTQQLWQAADLGLIQPLMIDEVTNLNDFYPFAKDAVTYNEKIYGVPYVADVVHLAYFQNQVESAPTTWSQLLETNQVHLFPVGNPSGPSSESLLLQYVGGGGQLLNNGDVSDPEAVESLFQFLATSKSEGIIPPNTLDFPNLESVWSAFISNGAGFANVSANMMLQRGEVLEGIKVSQVPTENGLPTTIARTWAFAILTNDQEQRPLTINLLQQLLDPTAHGSWSQLARYLPSQREALEAWGGNNLYYDFLRRQLEIAIVQPNGPAFAEFSKKLQAAQIDILRGELTPQEAMLKVHNAPP